MNLSILIPARNINKGQIPCRNGHLAERRVSDRRCVECVWYISQPFYSEERWKKIIESTGIN